MELSSPIRPFWKSLGFIARLQASLGFAFDLAFSFALALRIELGLSLSVDSHVSILLSDKLCSKRDKLLFFRCFNQVLGQCKACKVKNATTVKAVPHSLLSSTP